ncbi:MAG: branched-chain amino acid transport system permease protein, partial [Rhodospirillaceae bacterium]
MIMQVTLVKRRRHILNTALRETVVTGVLAMVLAVPFLGLKATNAGIGLKLETRWSMAALAVGLAMIGRILLVLWRERRHKPLPIGRMMTSLSNFLPERSLFWIGGAGTLFAFLLPVLFPSRYVVDTATTLLIYVMLGWGLNIVVGLAGLLDLGYVAFYAVGAYSYALLSTQFGWSFWLCLPVAGLLAAAFGILLGFPVLRLRGDYLAIVTLGFGEIIRVVLTNWSEVTNGSQGIAGISRPSFFGLPFVPEGTASSSLSFSEF